MNISVDKDYNSLDYQDSQLFPFLSPRMELSERLEFD